MPYISSTTSFLLGEDQKDIIKSKLGKLIEEIPGKSEKWLMIGFSENNTMYFNGEKSEKLAFIEVKILGSCDIKYKEILTDKISALFQQELNISKENIYIIFQEINDWGWNGNMF